MTRTRTLLVCLAILLLGGATTTGFFLTEPEAERGGAVRETAMLVDVVEVERGTFRPTLVASGTVEPARDITLSPRVGGRIVDVSPHFVPGGRVQAGDVMVRIDPSDYENDLDQVRSELSQARADLAVEEGRQDVARQDLALLGDTVATQDRSLVLREPQLEAAQARVEAAEAAVDQARLDLERTVVRAPFDAEVLRRDVNLGSEVAPGAPLARLVGTSRYWVVATIPRAQLRWLDLPTAEGEAPRARILDRTAWDEGEERVGRVIQVVGALEDRTRLARIIVEVEDPTGVASDAADGSAPRPPLLIGSFVEVSVEGEALQDVVRIDRDLVRDDDTVWVMEDGALEIRDVEVVMRDRADAYVRSGLESGDRVVTTNLATVADGAALRVEEPPESASSAPASSDTSSPGPAPSEPAPSDTSSSDGSEAP